MIQRVSNPAAPSLSVRTMPFRVSLADVAGKLGIISITKIRIRASV